MIVTVRLTRMRQEDKDLSTYAARNLYGGMFCHDQRTWDLLDVSADQLLSGSLADSNFLVLCIKAQESAPELWQKDAPQHETQPPRNKPMQFQALLMSALEGVMGREE